MLMMIIIIIRKYIHSFIHSSFIHSSFIHSSFIHHSFIHSFIPFIYHSFIHSYIHSEDPSGCHKKTGCGTCHKHTNIQKYHRVKIYTVIYVRNTYHQYMQKIHPYSKMSVHINIFRASLYWALSLLRLIIFHGKLLKILIPE
jgi:hypothetical protein